MPHERTPLQKSMNRLIQILIIAAAFLCGLLALVRVYQGHGWPDALLSAATLAVAAIPEEFSVVFTFFLGVGIYRLAKKRALVRRAVSVENIGRITQICTDKTGTITKGKPELVSFTNLSSENDEKLLSILATLENKSEHPIAHAIVMNAKEKGIQLEMIEDFESLKGKGLKGKVLGQEYFVGSLNLVKDLNLTFDTSQLENETKEGKTPVILATSKNILAIISVADAIKPESIEAIKELHKQKIKVVMLTGDNKNTAQFIGKLVGIDEVYAEVMPADKLNIIKDFQNKGKIVAMAGDGVNDAPALAQADVGIAMATGTDVAIESAGITLLHGDISKIVKAIKLSKMTMLGIKQNLFWAFFYNIIGIPLAGGLFYPFFGWLLSPVFAGLAMAFSSVSVVGNSLRLKTKKL
jgi:heavy metal translocating P-type ATPase